MTGPSWASEPLEAAGRADDRIVSDGVTGCVMQVMRPFVYLFGARLDRLRPGIALLDIRDTVMKFLEIKREKDIIGSSLEAKIVLYTENDELKSFIRENIDLFPALFKVSQAEVADSRGEDMEKAQDLPLEILIKKADGEKCPRCWNFSEKVGSSKEFPELCQRCSSVMSERRNNG